MSSESDLKKILCAKKCGDLFSFDVDAAKVEYRTMVKSIHPDICKDDRADDAMKKLNKLYAEAEKAFETGYGWEATNKIWIPCVNVPGKKHVSVSYRWHNTFEFGDRYVCNEAVVYLFRQGCDRYWKNASKMVKSIKYRDHKMEQEMSRFMPVLTMEFDTPDGGHAQVYKKTPDVLPMDVLIRKYGVGISDRHVAWMISRLCNLSCFLECTGASYNAFELSNLYVSVRYHSISLIGGWWYAVPIGQKMVGVTRYVYEQMPENIRFKKTGAAVTDLECVKAIGRDLMQYASSMPEPVMQWVNSGSSEHAVKEFVRWNNALDKAYGKRTFVKFDIDEEHFYE